MNSIVILAILIIAVIEALAFIKAKSKADIGDEIWPFYAKTPLSQPEQALYFRFVLALPDHIVLA